MSERSTSFSDPFRKPYDLFGENRRDYIEQGFKVVELQEDAKKGAYVQEFKPSFIGGLADSILEENSVKSFVNKAKNTVLAFKGAFFEPSRAQYPKHRIRDLGYVWTVRQGDVRDVSQGVYIHINDLGEIVDMKRD